MSQPVVIGLSAVVMGLREGELAALAVRHDGLPGLPFGPFAPEGSRTFELALRAFVAAQTGFDLGYVEQLYTFGDQGRDAPLADVGAGAARVVSVGYLALTATAADAARPDASWLRLYKVFPWEDWRQGRPPTLDRIAEALRPWIDQAPEADARAPRRDRVEALFALGDGRWNEERVLERYELLYEAGLVAEAARDHASAPAAAAGELGVAMLSDHRRILATALGRLRGKLKYRPVIFELTPAEFTLSELQRAVEATAGVPLHKGNFRRMVERTGLVESVGRLSSATGGRPAELFRASPETRTLRSGTGISLPLAG